MPDISPVVAVIQARMSSSRLPGKVLMPIAGKPLLWHIVHRLGKCRTVDKIAIATSVDPRDDAIAEFCASEGIICVRGSLPNVLDRYRLAAEQTGARTLLRVTGDSPLIDPDFVDYLVGAVAKQDSDFAVLEPGALCAHEGVDVFSRRALNWLIDNAGDDPVAREHVTSYFKLHPEGIKILVLPAYPPLAHPYGRLSVDTVDDLTMVRALYDRFGAAPGELKLTDALALMSEDPSFGQINAHVRQKTMGQVERHALICCQAGHKAGLGHLRRSLSLARALRDSQGIGVVIGLHGDEAAAGLIRAASFEVVMLEQADDLEALASGWNFSLAIVDVKDWLSRADIATLRRRIFTVAVIDDGSERRLAASHAYYPPVPQAYELSWEGSACSPRIGWNWCVLGFDPGRTETRHEQNNPLRILVSMGGADPSNKTALALEALKRMDSPFEAEFVIGPAFADAASLSDRITQAGFKALTGLSDLAACFAGADIVLAAFGVTAFELAALGVPALYLPASPDHARAAAAFVSAGLGRLLPENASAAEIAAALGTLIKDGPGRRAMRLAGPRTVDGKGAGHIAADLADALAS